MDQPVYVKMAYISMGVFVFYALMDNFGMPLKKVVNAKMDTHGMEISAKSCNFVLEAESGLQSTSNAFVKKGNSGMGLNAL